MKIGLGITLVKQFLNQTMSPAIEYLLQDEFTTPDDAPITSPRTAEPGPGTLYVNDTGSDLSMGGGEVQSTGGTDWNNPSLSYDSGLSRAAGIFVYADIPNRGTVRQSISIVPTKGGRPTGTQSDSLHFMSNNKVYIYESSSATIIDDGDYNNTSFELGIVVRSVGAFFVMKGGPYTAWTLVWITAQYSQATIYPQLGLLDNGVSANSFRVAQLPTPWDTDNGIATDSIASPIATDTFTHEADCLIEFTVDTLPSAGNYIVIYFRIQDANNKWYILIDNGSLRFYEIVSGSPTLRGEALSVLSNGVRIVAICDDETITFYYNNTQAFSYASAVNFKTETDGEISQLAGGAVISNLITWPRTLSGDALTALEAYTQPYDPWTGYWLQDEFTTPDAAPITSPRTAEPGPGTLTVTDTGNLLDIAGGVMSMSGTATGLNDPIYKTVSSYARSAGLMLSASLSITNLGSTYSPSFGWSDLATPSWNQYSYAFNYFSSGTPKIRYFIKTFYDGANSIGSFTFGSPQTYQIILRSTGAFLVSQNKILYVMADRSDTPLYAAIASQDAGRYPYDVDSFRVAQLAAPWTTDNGIATDSIASPSAGNTFTHEADCLFEFTVDSLPSAGAISIFFRIQDSSNYWQLYINYGGGNNTLGLYEIVAGSGTSRGGANVVNVNDRIVLICDDETITAYCNNALAWSYGSATNFKTATGGELDSLGTDGVISNLITWPRTLSGTALTALEAYTT